MVRKSAHELIEGFDESLRTGFEDWDYWVRMADRGFWGSTMPEYRCLVSAPHASQRPLGKLG